MAKIIKRQNEQIVDELRAFCTQRGLQPPSIPVECWIHDSQFSWVGYVVVGRKVSKSGRENLASDARGRAAQNWLNTYGSEQSDTKADAAVASADKSKQKLKTGPNNSEKQVAKAGEEDEDEDNIQILKSSVSQVMFCMGFH